MTKTALITGANGFVGGAVARMLLNEGWRVVLFDIPGHALWTQWQGTGAACIEGDIRSADDCERAMIGCSHVIHTAALLNSVVPYSVFEDVNLRGTRNLCDAARRSGVQHFIYVSTSDVFGIPSFDGECFDECSPYRQWGEPYADTKISATRLVRSPGTGIPVTVLYPGWVYGPGDRQFFPAIIHMVRDRLVFLWHKRDPYEINLIHIDDFCRAVRAVIDQPDRSMGQDFLILDEHSGFTPERLFAFIAAELAARVVRVWLPYPLMHTIAAVSQWLTRRGITRKALLSTTDVKAFGHAFRYSTSKASSVLGWRPLQNPEEGVRAAIRWQLSVEASDPC